MGDFCRCWIHDLQTHCKVNFIKSLMTPEAILGIISIFSKDPYWDVLLVLSKLNITPIYVGYKSPKMGEINQLTNYSYY